MEDIPKDDAILDGEREAGWDEVIEWNLPIEGAKYIAVLCDAKLYEAMFTQVPGALLKNGGLMNCETCGAELKEIEPTFLYVQDNGIWLYSWHCPGNHHLNMD